MASVRLHRERVEDWGSYPFSMPGVRHLEELPLHRAVTFLVGENGSGKSTLLEALAVRLGGGAKGREAAALLFAAWQGQMLWLAVGGRGFKLKDAVKRLT